MKRLAAFLPSLIGTACAAPTNTQPLAQNDQNPPGIYSVTDDFSCQHWTDTQDEEQGNLITSWILGFATAADTVLHAESSSNRTIYSVIKDTHDIINPAFAWCKHNPTSTINEAASHMLNYLLQSGDPQQQKKFIDPEWLKEIEVASTQSTQPTQEPENTSTTEASQTSTTSPDASNLESIFHPAMTGEKISFPAYDIQGTNRVCTAQWTQAGVVDHGMVHHCLEGQQASYRKLLLFLDKNHGFPWMKNTVEAILQKWTKYGVIDYNMTMYELKENQGKYKDLKYFYENRKEDKGNLSSALEEAQETSGYLDFNMADYNYKERANIPH